MKLLYKNQSEGTWFSKHGWEAFNRGEKPAWMWPVRSDVEPTYPHHVARLRERNNYGRWLVMFYRLKKK